MISDQRALGIELLADVRAHGQRIGHLAERTLDAFLVLSDVDKNLRRKLLDAGSEEEPIRSVYGVGYRLETLGGG